MQVAQLLTDLRHRGFTLTPEGDHLRVAPKSALTHELREVVAAQKDRLVALLSLEARIAQMSVKQFQQEGCPIEVAVPWLRETLWFVPSDRDAEALAKKGVTRGRVWTAAELAMLWSVPALTQEKARTIATIKTELGGEISAAEALAEIETDLRTDRDDFPTSCRACRGTRFWRSIQGQLICEVCHPPASETLIKERVSPTHEINRFSNRGISDVTEKPQH